jgi:hypothetical protein
MIKTSEKALDGRAFRIYNVTRWYDHRKLCGVCRRKNYNNKAA